MLIITADDYGKTDRATDNILNCFTNRRVSSSSGMVFMDGSQRAAALALDSGIEVGLHLNFTEPFTASETPVGLLYHQRRVRSYLNIYKLSQMTYNPLLTSSFKIIYRAQLDEFIRLYHKEPDFINGHHHMHLCANVLLGGLIPKGARLRRSFLFSAGEKNLLNRYYRGIINAWLSAKYISTDSLFNIEPINKHERIKQIISRATKENVEIEVHPDNETVYDYLLSSPFKLMIDSVQIGKFQSLGR